MLIVNIPGKPVPCPRPKVTKNGRVYYPEGYDVHIKAIKYLARSERNKARMKMFTGDIELDVTFFSPHRGADIDNLLKTVFDGLQDAIYLNDKQVKRLRSHIDYDEEPGTLINVWEIE